jgi:hypothetical protein
MPTQIDVDAQGNEYALSVASGDVDQIIEIIVGGITKLNQVNGETVPGYFSDKLNNVINAKSGIKEAIEDKGVQVPADTPFRFYPVLIQQIQGGPDYIAEADERANQLLNILGIEEVEEEV